MLKYARGDHVPMDFYGDRPCGHSANDVTAALSRNSAQPGKKVDVVVLMAGKGRRLLPLTEDRPKSLLLCEEGISIFEHIVRSFLLYDWVPTIIPVVGHGRLKVYEKLEQLGAPARFVPVANPFYSSAGPLVSFWLGLARSENERVVILNGDTLIRLPLVTDLARWIFEAGDPERPEVGACVSTASQFHPDDMKILLDKKGNFQQAGKGITPGANVVKSAGVIAVRDVAAKEALRRKLDDMLMEGEALRTGYYWHNILNDIKPQFRIELIKVEHDSWHEVDNNFDLNTINNA